MCKWILFITLFITCGTLHAQSIDTIIVSPSKPDACDKIDLTIEGFVPNTAISVDSSDVQVTGNQVNVKLVFKSQGIGNPTFVSYSETVSVGQLPVGSNDIFAEARFQGNQTDKKDTTIQIQSCCSHAASFDLSSDSLCPWATGTATQTDTGQIISWIIDSTHLSNTQPSLPISFSESGDHLVTLITSSGGCTDTARDTVTVHPVPDTSPIVKDSAQLIAPQAKAYQWLMNGQLLQDDTMRSLKPDQKGDYRVIISNQYGCVDTTSSYTINCSGLAQFSISSNEVCLGDTVIAESLSPDSLGSQWLINGTPVDTNRSMLPVTFSDTAEQYLSLRVTNYLCADTAKDTIIGRPLPDKPTISQPNANELHAPQGFRYQWFKDGQKLQGDTSQVHNFEADGFGIYRVVVTNSYGCSDTSDAYEPVINRLVENESNSFNVWPNPASSQLTIRFPKAYDGKNVSVSLFDMAGQELVRKMDIQTRGRTHQLSIADVESGVYVLSISNPQTIQHKKVILR